MSRGRGEGPFLKGPAPLPRLFPRVKQAFFQIYAAFGGEGHAFGLKQAALVAFAAEMIAGQHFPEPVDDPVAGKIPVLGNGMHGIAHVAGRADVVQNVGYLAVSHDLARRDARDKIVNPGKKTGFFGCCFHGAVIARKRAAQKMRYFMEEAAMAHGLIRFARPGDAGAILAIYAPFVTDTATTFECEAPSERAFADRIAGIAAVYPYIVHERAGEVLAYAYASKHMERAAYAWDVQTSVYAAPEARGTGVARALYAALFTLLGELGYCNAYAVITTPNPRSERFHASFGFEAAGVHYKSGYKLGAWHDVAWMQKRIGEYPAAPVPPRPVSALPPEFCRAVFAGGTGKCV